MSSGFPVSLMSWSKGYEDGKKAITVGPWGGNYGTEWDDGLFTTVRQLIIFHGSDINAILIEYDKNGRSEWSKMHGRVGGSKIDIIRLDYPHEFFTAIGGSFDSDELFEAVRLDSLTLYSNRRKYGPYGVQTDGGVETENFICRAPSSRIVGFHGKSNAILWSIGVHIQLDNCMNPSVGTSDARGDSNMGNKHESIPPAPGLSCEKFNFQRCLEDLQDMEGLSMEQVVAAVNFLSDDKMAIAFLTLKGPVRLTWLLSSMKNGL